MTTSYHSESFDTDEEINFYYNNKKYKDPDELCKEIINKDLKNSSQIVSNLNNDEESQNKYLNEKSPILSQKYHSKFKISGSDDFINNIESNNNKKINKLLLYYACFLSIIIVCMTSLILFIVIIILLDYFNYVQLNTFNYKNF